MTRHLDVSLLTVSEFQRGISSSTIFVQPLGAVEQHGPHLPLATDLIIAEEVGRAGVRRAVDEGLDVWLLPPLTYTKSNEHAWSPGTVWLSADTMQAVVSDLGRSIAKTSCRKLVFLNGHGGNSSLMSMMSRELRLEHGLLTFLAHPALPADRGGSSHLGELGMGVHGGHDETSLMLHLRPELVDMKLAKRNIPEHLADNRHLRFGGSVQFGWLSNDFGETGVIGDPEGATAEHGRRAFDSAVESFCEALAEIDAYGLWSE